MSAVLVDYHCPDEQFAAWVQSRPAFQEFVFRDVVLMGAAWKAAKESLKESQMKIKVLEDRILVRRIERATQSAGGIIIPDQYQEKATEAEALVVGPGFWLENGTHREMGVAVGDRVLLGKYAGTEITVDGEPLVIIRESDVLGVILVKEKR